MIRRLISVSFFAALFTAATWLLLATACTHLPKITEPIAASPRRTVDPATGWDGVRDYRRFCVGVCQACRLPKRPTEWHHIYPQSQCTGALEYLRYVETNGLELCRDCHSAYGHGHNFHRWNANVKATVESITWTTSEGSAGE